MKCIIRIVAKILQSSCINRKQKKFQKIVTIYNLFSLNYLFLENHQKSDLKFCNDLYVSTVFCQKYCIIEETYQG